MTRTKTAISSYKLERTNIQQHQRMDESQINNTDQTRKRKPSYRRNRDYRSHITWTYELNRDLYECYKNSQPEEKKYTLRMKEIWDELRPKYAHLTTKHLAEQARRIVKKNLVANAQERPTTGMQTRRNHREANMVAEQTSEHVTQPVNTEGDNPMEENTSNIETPQDNTDHVNTDQQEHNTTDENENIDTEMLDEIKQAWNVNFNKYKDTPLKDREYQTKLDRNMPEIELVIANRIVSEFIQEQAKDGISLSDINVASYLTAVTLLERIGWLKPKTNAYKKPKRGWQTQAENRINSLRKKLSYIDEVEKCKQTNTYTNHQQKIKQKLKKWYGNIKKDNLDARKTTLKLELKSETETLRRRKEVEERKRVNYQSTYNPKQLYREFKGETKIRITKPPSEADIKDFCSNIWSRKKVYNVNAPWLEVLEQEYCTNVTQKHYEEKLRYISQNINENEKQHSTWNRSHCSVLVGKIVLSPRTISRDI